MDKCKPMLDEYSKTALFELMIDRQKTDLDIFKALYKGVPLKYGNADEQEECEQKETSKEKRSSNVGGSYGVDSIKKVGVTKKANTAKIIGNKFAAQRELTKFMTAFMTEEYVINGKSDILIKKYIKELKYNDDGTPQNIVALEEKFKKEISEGK